MVNDITVAFYKGEGLRRDRIVRWWTGSPYSHVELIMPNGTMTGITPPDYPVIRTKSITGIQKTDWDFIDISVTEQQLISLRRFIDSTKGQGYDWVGMIVSHLTPFKVRIPNKWYCSEWVAYALSVSKVLTWKQMKLYDIPRMPPGRLYNLLKKAEGHLELSS
jgi:hypothetical protein